MSSAGSREFEQTQAKRLKVGDIIRLERRTVSIREITRMNSSPVAPYLSIGFNAIARDGTLSRRDGWTTIFSHEFVQRALPSDVPSRVQSEQSNPHHQKEATMATITRKKAATKTAPKSAPKAAPKETAKSNGSKAAKFNPTPAEVKEIAKRLQAGTKMNEIKAEHGLSNGQAVRKALVAAGFDSKGAPNPQGLSARELQTARRTETATAKTPAKKSVKKTAAPKRAASAKKAAADPSPEA